MPKYQSQKCPQLYIYRRLRCGVKRNLRRYDHYSGQNIFCPWRVLGWAVRSGLIRYSMPEKYILIGTKIRQQIERSIQKATFFGVSIFSFRLARFNVALFQPLRFPSLPSGLGQVFTYHQIANAQKTRQGQLGCPLNPPGASEQAGDHKPATGAY